MYELVSKGETIAFRICYRQTSQRAVFLHAIKGSMKNNIIPYKGRLRACDRGLCVYLQGAERLTLNVSVKIAGEILRPCTVSYTFMTQDI